MADPDSKTKPIVDRLRGSQRVLVIALIALLALTSVAVASSHYEDLTTYTEYDPNNELTIDNSNLITITDMRKDSEAAIYKDVGSIGRTNITFDYSMDENSFASPSGDAADPEAYYALVSEGSRESGSLGSYVGIRIHARFTGSNWVYDSYLESDIDSKEFPPGDIVDNKRINLRVFTHNDTAIARFVPSLDDEKDVVKINISDGNYDTLHVVAGANTGAPTADGDDTFNGTVSNVVVDSSGTLYDVEGTVSDGDNQALEGVDVVANQSGSTVVSDTTDLNGKYTLALENGTYNVTASKTGYFSQTKTVTVNGGDVTQDFTLINESEALTIDTRPFLEHGETATYTVTFTNTTSSGAENRTDVTDTATVTSGDTNVLTIDTLDNEIVATTDTSVNNETYVQANYTAGDGTVYTTRYNVTVANLTVDNLDILPPVQRFSASLSGGTNANPNDRTILLLIIGAAAGGAASIIASSFAGVAALTMIMMLGWILGATSDGMAIVTVFIAMFVGLNVAGNVDYSIRG